MFIYELRPTEKGQPRLGYDCYAGHVVIANSSVAARSMVPHGGEADGGYTRTPDKRTGFWTDPELSSCVAIGHANVASPRVVINDFHAG